MAVSMTFDEWMSTLRLDEPDEGGEVGTASPGMTDFLREVFHDHGAVSSGELSVLVQNRELELAERVVPLLIADIRRTTDLDPHIEVRTINVGADWGQPAARVTAVTFDGSFSTVPLALRMPEIICDIADNVRDQVIDELCTVWPVCPRDGLGLDPRVVRDQAVWYCRVHDHVAAPIGGLSTHG